MFLNLVSVVFNGKTLAPKMDAFRNTSEDFYKDILKGKANVSDFERYIYGNGT